MLLVTDKIWFEVKYTAIKTCEQFLDDLSLLCNTEVVIL